MADTYHVPIMLSEVIELLSPERGGIFVDGTLGGGGHSQGILSRLPEGSSLYGIDRDDDALEAAGYRLRDYSAFKPIKGNFFNMKALLSSQGVTGVDGILLDLGVSSHQLDDGSRGFSYGIDAPLDMRMDRTQNFSAYDVVNGYSSKRLFEIIRDYGEERFSSRIANSIVAAREKHPIKTTAELSEIIKAAIPAAARREGPHPAKRTFQAIRIEVNGELNGLENAVTDAVDLLNPDGVIAIISFHSLEARIVKTTFRRLANPCTCPKDAPLCICGKKPIVRLLTGKPITASDAELESNPRARSAELRGAVKLIPEGGTAYNG